MKGNVLQPKAGHDGIDEIIRRFPSAMRSRHTQMLQGESLPRTRPGGALGLKSPKVPRPKPADMENGFLKAQHCNSWNFDKRAGGVSNTQALEQHDRFLITGRRPKLCLLCNSRLQTYATPNGGLNFSYSLTITLFD
jgi:hypothetical protein